MMFGDTYYRVVERLKQEEGFSGVPYTCSTGHPTVGYGTVFPLTKPEAEALLRHRLTVLEGELTHGLLDGYKVRLSDLPDAVQRALCDLAYNLGVPRLMKFKRMLRAIQERNWATAAHECLDSRYASQVPRRARRNADLLASPGGLRADNRTEQAVI